MTTYINTEEMRRAAGTFDNAIEDFRRIVGTFDEAVHRLVPLLGQGYGSNIDRLIEALENHTEALSKQQIKE